ncbi:hypothetical protein GV64_03695 [Endozoicomonas elysicola]|uniref:Uncharacterized protein n=1 Tax=Endozoicomonas elysicola TaxID=305900 RepID=A0A081K741_9GAMM|nr:hypothetical protein GV64_03695 [Endozoicomonas elysicola]
MRWIILIYPFEPALGLLKTTPVSNLTIWVALYGKELTNTLGIGGLLMFRYEAQWLRKASYARKNCAAHIFYVKQV